MEDVKKVCTLKWNASEKASSIEEKSLWMLPLENLYALNTEIFVAHHDDDVVNSGITIAANHLLMGCSPGIVVKLGHSYRGVTSSNPAGYLKDIFNIKLLSKIVKTVYWKGWNWNNKLPGLAYLCFENKLFFIWRYQ